MKVRWKFGLDELEKHKEKIRKPQMFDDEMKDLAMVYKSGIEQASQQLSNVMPNLVHFMQQFIELYETKECMEEKLENLIDKINPQGDEDE